MKEKIAWSGWIVSIVLIVVLLSNFFLNKSSGKNEIWEYTTVVRINEDDQSSKRRMDELNDLGNEGWELVTQEDSDAPGIHILVFKRRK